MGQLQVNEMDQTMIYHEHKYNKDYPPMMNYLPHEYLIKKMVFVIAEQAAHLDKSQEFGGRWENIKRSFGILDFVHPGYVIQKMNEQDGEGEENQQENEKDVEQVKEAEMQEQEQK